MSIWFLLKIVVPFNGKFFGPAGQESIGPGFVPFPLPGRELHRINLDFPTVKGPICLLIKFKEVEWHSQKQGSQSKVKEKHA